MGKAHNNYIVTDITIKVEAVANLPYLKDEWFTQKYPRQMQTVTVVLKIIIGIKKRIY